MSVQSHKDSRAIEEYSFKLRYKNSNVSILITFHEGNLDRIKEKCRDYLIKLYEEIEGYIIKNPYFFTSFEPLTKEELINAPDIIKAMNNAARSAGVGPMACVAGAIAEYLLEFLISEFSLRDVIVENGGDIAMRIFSERMVKILAKTSKFSDRLALKIKEPGEKIGICTSSGKMGHSISLGKADSVTVVARSSMLADAAATAIANSIKNVTDIEKGLKLAKSIGGVDGVIIIYEDKLACFGNLPELTIL